MEELRNCTEKFIFLDGYKFTLDEKTGYYRCNKIRQRLHRYVWEEHNGEIPKGYHVHHKDHNKANNHIDNLVLVGSSKHAKHHMDERENSEEYLKWRAENLAKNARPKASEWHKSEEGRKWHSEMAKESAKNRELVVFHCENCKKEYEAWNTSKNKFCSNKCKSAWRRKQGLDDETRICECCGKEFVTNKYKKIRYCSKSCSNRAIPRLPQNKD